MKCRDIIGICLVILGIAVCATGIGVHIGYLHQQYQRFVDNGCFDSFFHYYWTVGKANLAASIIAGIFPVGIGLIIIEHRALGVHKR